MPIDPDGDEGDSEPRSRAARPAARRRTRRREFELGEAIGKTFSIWGANFIPFNVMSL